MDETVQMRTSSASRPSRRTRQSGFDGINRDPVEPDELCLIGAATVSCVSEEERPASIANPLSTFPTGVAQPEPVASVLSEQQGRAYSVPTSVFTGSLRVAGFVRPPSVGVQPKEVEVPSANHEQGHQIAVGRRAQQMVQAGGAKASIQGSGVEEPSGEKLGAVLWPGAGSPDTAWHVRSAERRAQGVHPAVRIGLDDSVTVVLVRSPTWGVRLRPRWCAPADQLQHHSGTKHTTIVTRGAGGSGRFWRVGGPARATSTDPCLAPRPGHLRIALAQHQTADCFGSTGWSPPTGRVAVRGRSYGPAHDLHACDTHREPREAGRTRKVAAVRIRPARCALLDPGC